MKTRIIAISIAADQRVRPDSDASRRLGSNAGIYPGQSARPNAVDGAEDAG